MQGARKPGFGPTKFRPANVSPGANRFDLFPDSVIDHLVLDQAIKVIRDNIILDALDERLRLAIGNIASPTGRYVWALSGGGAKGAFQVGAAHALYRDPPMRPRGFATTSIGSVNALKFAEGTYASVCELGEIWLGLRHRTEVYAPATWLRSAFAVLEAKEISAEPIVRGLVGALGGTAAAALTVPSNSFSSELRGLLRSFDGTLDLIEGFAFAGGLNIASAVLGPASHLLGFAVRAGRAEAEEYVKAVSRVTDMLDGTNLRSGRGVYADGIFSFDPLRQMMDRHVDIGRVNSARLPVRFVAVGAASGLTFHLHSDGRVELVLPDANGTPIPRQVATITEADRKQAFIASALASASVPVFNQPIKIEMRFGAGPGATAVNSVPMVDGGVREVLPVDAAIDVIERDLQARARRARPERDGSADGEGGSDQSSSGSIGVIGIALGTTNVYREDLLVDELRQSLPEPLAGDPVDVLTVMFAALNAQGDEVSANEQRLLREKLLRTDDALLIAPSFPLGELAVIDPGQIQLQLAYGYMTAFDVLTARERRLSAEEYRRGLWRSTNEILQRRATCWSLEGKGFPLFRQEGVSLKNRGRDGKIIAMDARDPDGTIFTELYARLARQLPRAYDFVVARLARVRILKRQILEHLRDRVVRFGLESLPTPLEISGSERYQPRGASYCKAGDVAWVTQMAIR